MSYAQKMAYQKIELAYFCVRGEERMGVAEEREKMG